MIYVGTLLDVINEAAFRSQSMNDLAGRRQNNRLYKPLPKRKELDVMPSDLRRGKFQTS